MKTIKEIAEHLNCKANDISIAALCIHTIHEDKVLWSVINMATKTDSYLIEENGILSKPFQSNLKEALIKFKG